MCSEIIINADYTHTEYIVGKMLHHTVGRILHEKNQG